ncbi:hypothetical protein CIRG_09933 [Coccidioides immitis RMSCC 2394]|uniref:Myb-like domain-containing protein n=1 Tax=Coccidioides immitis RMSCC 2394 TaxID=404692 RepID=A0A0J7BIR1_COCIT|nr:hypothetical protein CIRG_09933 [Coccidioides immitis RMSCC 2394]
MQFVNYTPSNPEPKTALRFPHKFAPALTPASASLPLKPHFQHCDPPPVNLPSRPESLLPPPIARSPSVPQAFPVVPAPPTSHPLPAPPPSWISGSLSSRDREWSQGGGPDCPPNDFDREFIENGIVGIPDNNDEGIVDSTTDAAPASADHDPSDHGSQPPLYEADREHQGTTRSPPSDLGAGDADTAVGAETETHGQPGSSVHSSNINANPPESVSVLHPLTAAGREGSCRVSSPRLGSPVQFMEAVVVRTASGQGREDTNASACDMDQQMPRARPLRESVTKRRPRRIPGATSQAKAGSARERPVTNTDGHPGSLKRRSCRKARPAQITHDGSANTSDDDYHPGHAENRRSKRRRLRTRSSNTEPHYIRPQSQPQAPMSTTTDQSVPCSLVTGQDFGQRRLSPEDVSAIVSATAAKLLEILRGSAVTSPPAVDQRMAVEPPQPSTGVETRAELVRKGKKKKARWTRQDDERLESMRARGWRWWEIKQQFPHRTVSALQQRCMKLQGDERLDQPTP